jgi:hypothetical protein
MAYEFSTLFENIVGEGGLLVPSDVPNEQSNYLVCSDVRSARCQPLTSQQDIDRWKNVAA